MWDPTNMAMTDDALGALDMAPGQGADQIPIDPTVYHMGSDSMAHSSLSLAEPPMEAASTLLHYSGNYSS